MHPEFYAEFWNFVLCSRSFFPPSTWLLLQSCGCSCGYVAISYPHVAILTLFCGYSYRTTMQLFLATMRLFLMPFWGVFRADMQLFFITIWVFFLPSNDVSFTLQSSSICFPHGLFCGLPSIYVLAL